MGPQPQRCASSDTRASIRWLRLPRFDVICFLFVFGVFFFLRAHLDRHVIVYRHVYIYIYYYHYDYYYVYRSRRATRQF